MSSTQTHTTTKKIECRVSLDYLKTPQGILKIVELVLTIIAFGCAAHVADYFRGYGWVSFVTITAFLKALISLILHILMDSNWTVSYMVELILYAIWTVLLLIAGIVAAALTHDWSTAIAATTKILSSFVPYFDQYSWDTAVIAIAATVFTWFSLIVWAIDTALQAKDVRITRNSGPTTTTTTSAAPTSYPENPQRFDGNPQY